MSMEKVIYTATCSPTTARRRARGLAASAFKGGDGRWHVYLNSAVPHCVPPATLDDSLCRFCGLGYSHVMSQKREMCNECVLQEIADAAISLQAEVGIDLGWVIPDDYRPLVMRPIAKADRWGMHKVRRST